MKKVRMIVEMDEEAYKALIGREVFNIWQGNTILSTVFNAIKTAKPIEKCDDAISRQAVRDFAKTVKNNSVFFAPTYADFDRYLAKLPSVLPKREQGEWIEVHPQAEWLDNKCSACGKGIEDLIDSREWYENERPNYCLFCGKKFKESED